MVCWLQQLERVCTKKNSVGMKTWMYKFPRKKWNL
jgi:hypothetical protein